ncbi:hypothetical protein H072_214 [Dactylellina haptotyla CBS 200.50]|uniref:Uncharacterized protein n=1 Tax=Dactylellina haptotyla (strain CBS 200.50) TaxID=1284197 RepID=S8C1R8_DACHA|nr:hypothetical protein H072_214 [Dactylellina haptotyla CBS 200.50]
MDLDPAEDQYPEHYYTYDLVGKDTVYTAYPSVVLQNMTNMSTSLREQERNAYRRKKLDREFERKREEIIKFHAEFTRVLDEIKSLFLIQSVSTTGFTAGEAEIQRQNLGETTEFDAYQTRSTNVNPHMVSGLPGSVAPMSAKMKVNENIDPSTHKKKKIPSFLRHEKPSPPHSPEPTTPRRQGRFGVSAMNRNSGRNTRSSGSRRPRTIPAERLALLDIEESDVRRRLNFT